MNQIKGLSLIGVGLITAIFGIIGYAVVHRNRDLRARFTVITWVGIGAIGIGVEWCI